MWIKESNYNKKLINQIFMFLNFYLSIIWWFSYMLFLFFKSSEIESLNLTLIVFCIVVGSLVEVLRIYLGYSGNLKSNVLDSAGFLILTTFIQLPVHLYLLISLYNHFYIIHLIIQATALILLPMEIVINYLIIKSSLKERSLQFQMMYNTSNSTKIS
ncbi:unnamed protein product [Diamesa hyperborea]